MIPVFKPAFGREEWEALREPMESGWIGLGPKTAEFEERFAAFAGAHSAVAVNSATAALELALHVLDVAGGEVITTPMTFVSTNHAILHNNAHPVFADLEPDTLNIRPAEIERLITPRTRAIIAVHYGGHPCDMDAIGEIARAHGIPVIEDAAHACGALYRGRPIGSISDLTCFSFHAVKNLATGDGGMITTADPNMAARLKRLRWLGISKDTWNRSEETHYSWYYDVTEAGFKCHMNDLTAALGIVQLGKLPRTNARRREIASLYHAAMSDIPGLELPVEKSYAQSAWHNYVIKVDGRDELMERLASRGIATGMHYYPNHLYELYAPYRRTLPVADAVWRKLVTLPLFPDLTNEQVTYICDSIRGELESSRHVASIGGDAASISSQAQA